MVSKKERLASASSYLVFGIMWYLLDSNINTKAFVKYHVRQALAMILVAIVLGIASFALLVGGIIHFVSSLLVLLWIIQGMFYALGAKKQPLLLIGSFAKNFKI